MLHNIFLDFGCYQKQESQKSLKRNVDYKLPLSWVHRKIATKMLII